MILKLPVAKSVRSEAYVTQEMNMRADVVQAVKDELRRKVAARITEDCCTTRKPPPGNNDGMIEYRMDVFVLSGPELADIINREALALAKRGPLY